MIILGVRVSHRNRAGAGRILDVYSSVSIYAGSEDRKYEII